MARRRRLRVRRTAGFLLLLALLVVLLELNRFLPGGWPGGGGDGGFRRWPLSATDRTRLRPPEDERPPLPPDGIRVVLRAPRGSTPAAGTVSVDRPGAETRAVDSEGGATVRDPDVLSAGLLVGWGDGAEVRHGPVDPSAAIEWAIHLPDPPLRPANAPGAVRLRVVAAEDGRPLAGAPVTVHGRTGPTIRVVGPDGGVVLADLATRTLVSVEAPDRQPVRRWIHPRLASPVVLRIPRTPRIDAAFVDAETGRPLELVALRLLTPAGEVLWSSEAGIGVPVSRTLEVRPGADLADALLEVRTASHPVVHVPLATLDREVRIPAGRPFEVKVRDNDTQRLPGGTVRAHYVPTLLGPPDRRPAEPLEVAVEVATDVPLPVDRPARLLVGAAASAPRTIEVRPDDESSRIVRLDPGIPVTIRVVDGQGAPVEGAEVVVHAASDGLRVTRRGRTLADGEATVRDLPAGPLEAYAHAPGQAWSVVTAEATRGGDTIRIALQPGRAIRLVVESPLGLPLAGVRVRTMPAEDGAVEIVGPDATPRRTGEDGTLILADLPDRPWRLQLSLPGYRKAVLDAVRPGPAVHFVTLVPEAR